MHALGLYKHYTEFRDFLAGLFKEHYLIEQRSIIFVARQRK